MRNNYSYRQRTIGDAYRADAMNSFLIFLAGVGTGAAIMYFMDPDRGRRRRALVRDQAVGLTNDARQAISATTGDLSNRAYGLYAETRKAVTGTPVSTGGENQSAVSGTERSNTGQTSETDAGSEIGRSATPR